MGRPAFGGHRLTDRVFHCYSAGRDVLCDLCAGSGLCNSTGFRVSSAPCIHLDILQPVTVPPVYALLLLWLKDREVRGIQKVPDLMGSGRWAANRRASGSPGSGGRTVQSARPLKAGREVSCHLPPALLLSCSASSSGVGPLLKAEDGYGVKQRVDRAQRKLSPHADPPAFILAHLFLRYLLHPTVRPLFLHLCTSHPPRQNCNTLFKHFSRISELIIHSWSKKKNLICYYLW